MAEKSKNKRSIVLSDNGYLSYIDFSKLSFADKLRRRLNIAKAQFNNGSLAKAGYALVGGYDPENPRLSTGDVPNPGMKNPKLIVQGILKAKQVAQKAKTIAERAAKISDRIFDRQYLRAINSGNPKRVLAVRNLHFSAKAPETKVVDIKGRPQLVIHKTPNNFTVFDNSRSFGKLNWTATQKAFEGENGVFATGAGTNPKEMHLYVNMKNPHYPTIEEGMEPAFIKEGEDGILGIVDKDITDFYKSASDAGEGFHMSLGVDNPYALKAYNSITYDNNGNIIPIFQRDNFLINDIRYKQGGKMNILEFLKNGSGIHIKEKNKGSFTRWCGGNVTEECIRKGKASSNPKIRKKATFADNARHFKHKEGGFFLSLKVNKHLAFVPGATITDSNPRAYSQIKKHKGDTEWIDKSSKGLKVKSNLNPKYYLKRKVEKASKGAAFGLKVSNALGKVGNFLNSDTGKLAINGITSMIGTTVLNKAIDKQIEANNKMKEVDIQKAKLDKYRKLLGLQDMTPEIDSSGNIINKSSIVALNNAYKQAMESTDTSEIQDTYDRVNRLLGNEKYMNLKDMLGDMVGTLSSILGGKKKDSSTNSNSYFGNYVNTLYKNYGTFNSDGSMNLGGRLGTFSTTGGYKPRQYQMKTYTPLLKFSL